MRSFNFWYRKRRKKKKYKFLWDFTALTGFKKSLVRCGRWTGSSHLKNLIPCGEIPIVSFGVSPKFQILNINYTKRRDKRNTSTTDFSLRVGVPWFYFINVYDYSTYPLVDPVTRPSSPVFWLTFPGLSFI